MKLDKNEFTQLMARRPVLAGAAAAGVTFCGAMGVNAVASATGLFGPLGQGTLISIFLCAGVVGPVWAQMTKARTHAQASYAALVAARREDRVTGTLQPTVFASTLEERRKTPAADRPRRGAFLLVELSALRAINLQHGHAWGDEALRCVAGAIRASVRYSDVVGRLGPDEFGVFLAGADKDSARDVAKRLEAAIEKAYFAPGGTKTLLKVSVVAVLFEHQVPFTRMAQDAERVLETVRHEDGEGVRFAIAALPQSSEALRPN